MGNEWSCQIANLFLTLPSQQQRINCRSNLRFMPNNATACGVNLHCVFNVSFDCLVNTMLFH